MEQLLRTLFWVIILGSELGIDFRNGKVREITELDPCDSGAYKLSKVNKLKSCSMFYFYLWLHVAL